MTENRGSRTVASPSIGVSTPQLEQRSPVASSFDGSCRSLTSSSSRFIRISIWLQRNVAQRLALLLQACRGLGSVVFLRFAFEDVGERYDWISYWALRSYS